MNRQGSRPERFRQRAQPAAILLAIASVLAIAIATPARAHRLESAMTTIESNSSTAQLEIIHEINYHDLEHVMSQLLGRSTDLASDLPALREAIEWLEEGFDLTDEDKRTFPLKRVGAEIDRGRLLIYYETTHPRGLTSLRVFNQMLMKLIPQQVNQVNIRIDGPTRTLVFRLGDGWKELPPALDE